MSHTTAFAKHDKLVEASMKWVLEKFDQKVLDSSEIDYRNNDEVSCSRIIGASGTVKGILTVWQDKHKLHFHFDKH